MKNKCPEIENLKELANDFFNIADEFINKYKEVKTNEKN